MKIFKAVPKKNPQKHSAEQNGKAVLTIAGYFKVSTPVRSQHGNIKAKGITTTETSIIKLEGFY